MTQQLCELRGRVGVFMAWTKGPTRMSQTHRDTPWMRGGLVGSLTIRLMVSNIRQKQIILYMQNTDSTPGGERETERESNFRE